MSRWMYLLLVAGGVAAVGRFLHWPSVVIFALACAGLIPMAGLIGRATEELAHHVGPRWGGLLNATFGNAAELIILIAALQKNLFTLAKASITGSIIGNLLLVLGASLLVGGLRNGVQRFDGREAGRNTVMMVLATIALIVPATLQGVTTTASNGASLIESISLAVAAVLLFVYVAYIVYGLTSREGETAEHDIAHAAEGETGVVWSLKLAVGVLLAATLGTVIFAETLVGTVEEATHLLGWSEFFVGVIIVPLVGNVAEHVSAIHFAYKNRMDIAQAIAAGSSTQVALLVAPLAVFLSLLFSPFDQAMNLAFHPIEVVIVAAASLAFAFISFDGESNWLEGIQLLAVYVIAGAVFFLLPVAEALPGH